MERSRLMPDGKGKSIRLFPGVPVTQGDPVNAFMRVSCYLHPEIFSSPEGAVTIPGRHVRFSVWVGDEARCVLSIPESEAVELARFVLAEMAPVAPESAAIDRPT